MRIAMLSPIAWRTPPRQYGKTGYLVDRVSEAVEAVKRLNELDPFYCRAHAMSKFSVENMVAEYIEVYKDITII